MNIDSKNSSFPTSSSFDSISNTESYGKLQSVKDSSKGNQNGFDDRTSVSFCCCSVSVKAKNILITCKIELFVLILRCFEFSSI